MAINKITAIIRDLRLEAVEDALKAVGVPSITVSRVKGYGQHANFCRSDWMAPHVRIEIIEDEIRVPIIVNAILESARTGEADDGLVYVESLDVVLRIRTGEALGNSAH